MFSRFKRQEQLDTATTQCVRAANELSPQIEQSETDERIEDYLEQVCGRLLTLSFPERKQIRQELGQHIEAMVEARCELGESRREAVTASLAQFGNPEKVAGSFVEAYLSSGKNRVLTLYLSTGKAFRSFGIAGLFTALLFIAWVSYLPAANIPAAARMVVHQWLEPAWFFLIPAALGWRLGADERTARPVFSSFLALAALSAVSLPLTYALFAGGSWVNQIIGGTSYIFAVWIPVAALGASVSRQIIRWRRSLRHA